MKTKPNSFRGILIEREKALLIEFVKSKSTNSSKTEEEIIKKFNDVFKEKLNEMNIELSKFPQRIKYEDAVREFKESEI